MPDFADHTTGLSDADLMDATLSTAFPRGLPSSVGLSTTETLMQAPFALMRLGSEQCGPLLNTDLRPSSPPHTSLLLLCPARKKSVHRKTVLSNCSIGVEMSTLDLVPQDLSQSAHRLYHPGVSF